MRGKVPRFRGGCAPKARVPPPHSRARPHTAPPAARGRHTRPSDERRAALDNARARGSEHDGSLPEVRPPSTLPHTHAATPCRWAEAAPNGPAPLAPRRRTPHPKSALMKRPRRCARRGAPLAGTRRGLARPQAGAHHAHAPPSLVSCPQGDCAPTLRHTARRPALSRLPVTSSGAPWRPQAPHKHPTSTSHGHGTTLGRSIRTGTRHREPVQDDG